MPPRRPEPWIEPPGLSSALSAAHAVVAVAGPHGSGRSSALAGWAHGRTDVHWVEDGVVPDVEGGFLVVDDADGLTPEVWTELALRMRRHVDLSLRVSVLSTSSLPAGWDVELAPSTYLGIDEIAELLVRLGSGADPTAVRWVSHGHPATVRLVARSRAESTTQMRRVVAQGPPAPVLAPEHSLLAVPRVLTPALAKKLGGPPSFVADALREGIARWTGDSDAPVFELVPSVRVQTRARVVMDAKRRAALRGCAAEHLIEHGALLAAVGEGVAASRPDLVNRALLGGGIDLMVDSPRELLMLLRGIPTSALVGHPIIAVLLATLLALRDGGRGRSVEVGRMATVGAAAALGTALGARGSPDRAVLRAIECAVERVAVLGDHGVGAARRSAKILAEMPSADREGLGALEGDVRANLAITLMYGGQHEEAREQADLVLIAPSGRSSRLLSLGVLAVTAVLAGRVREARTVLDRAEAGNFSEQLLDSHVGCFVRVAQALEAVERFDLEAASDALETVWPQIDSLEHWHLMAYARALVDVAAGHAADGLERFRNLRQGRERRRDVRRPDHVLLDHTESLLLLAGGEPASAEGVLRALRPSRCAVALGLARVALVRARDEEALRHLTSATPKNPSERMTADSIEAVVMRRRGYREEAVAAAERAAVVARVHELRTPLMLLPTGELDLFGDVAKGVPEAFPPVAERPDLTPRERVVLRHLALGTSLAEMAGTMNVSVNTAKSQRRSLYRKLGVSSREEAVVRALALELLPD